MNPAARTSIAMQVVVGHDSDLHSTHMTPTAKTLLKYLISVLLTCGLLYGAFRNTDFGKLSAAIRGANYWWMGGMFICLMVSHVFRALRWRYLLDPIKPNISFRNLFSGVIIGYFMNNVLPRAGELVRPYTIGKLESIPKSAALGTIVVERIMDSTSFLILAVSIPLVYHGALMQVFPWLPRASMIISIVTFGFLVIAITLMTRRDWTDTILGKATGFLPANLSSRFDKVIHSFLDGFLFIKRPGSFFVILILSVLVWFQYIMMTYLAFFSFGLENQLGFGAAVVVLAISSIGVAIPTPGATGGYHWFAAQALIRLFQVSNEVALSYATVTHAVGFVGVTVFGLYFFLHDHINIKDAMNKPEEQIG